MFTDHVCYQKKFAIIIGSEGRRCCACPRDLCCTKKKHSHRKEPPYTLQGGARLLVAERGIFSSSLMDRRMWQQRGERGWN